MTDSHELIEYAYEQLPKQWYENVWLSKIPVLLTYLLAESMTPPVDNNDLTLFRVAVAICFTGTSLLDQLTTERSFAKTLQLAEQQDIHVPLSEHHLLLGPNSTIDDLYSKKIIVFQCLVMAVCLYQPTFGAALSMSFFMDALNNMRVNKRLDLLAELEQSD